VLFQLEYPANIHIHSDIWEIRVQVTAYKRKNMQVTEWKRYESQHLGGLYGQKDYDVRVVERKNRGRYGREHFLARVDLA
jgi:hypothetical protein